MTSNAVNAFQRRSSRPVSSTDWRCAWARRPLTATDNILPSNRISRGVLLALLSAAIPLLRLHDAAAIPIKITDKAQLVATAPTCTGGGMNFKNCTSTAFINATSIDGTDADFSKEFKAWNATNPKGSQWTLVNGGALPGGTVDVTVFRAIANNRNGGLDITMSWDFKGDKTGFFWTQGLNLNYSVEKGVIVDPFDELDVNKNFAMPPLYPRQGGLYRNLKDSIFEDLPRGPWPDSFFNASAFLDKVDFKTKTLTIYEGVRYGFKLEATKAPEPAGILLLVPALLSLAAILCWRAWK